MQFLTSCRMSAVLFNPVRPSVVSASQPVPVCRASSAPSRSAPERRAAQRIGPPGLGRKAGRAFCSPELTGLHFKRIEMLQSDNI